MNQPFTPMPTDRRSSETAKNRFPAPKPPSLGANLVVFVLTEWWLADKRKLGWGIACGLASLGCQLIIRPYHYSHPFTDFGLMGATPSWLMSFGLARSLLAFPFFGQRAKWIIGVMLAILIWRESAALQISVVLHSTFFDPKEVIAWALAATLAYYFFTKHQRSRT